VTTRVRLDPASLDYREDVMAFLRDERAAGRRLVLATAADVTIAEAVSEHVQLFDEVIASDGTLNCKGAKKLTAIVARLGRDFDYMGDSSADLPILRAARRAILVAPSSSTEATARTAGNVHRVLCPRD
jgi:phosphoserine phosphatase